MAATGTKPSDAPIEVKNGQKPQVRLGKVDELLLRADTLMRLKNRTMFEEAKKTYDQVLELENEKKNKSALMGRAKAFIMLGDGTNARKDFKTLGADPDMAIPQAITELQMTGLNPPELVYISERGEIMR